MKKLLFALPVILLLAAGCNSSQPTAEQTQPTPTPQQVAQNPTPTQTAHPTPTTADKPSTVTKSGNNVIYTSYKLGFSFGVDGAFLKNGTTAKFQENGNTIKACRQYGNGQLYCNEYVQVFTKANSQSMTEAIKAQVLANYPSCVLETSNNHISLNIPGGGAIGAGMDATQVAKICPIQYVPGDHSAFFLDSSSGSKFVFVNDGQDGYIDASTVTFLQ